MRPIILIPIAIVLPFTVFSLLRAFTGDALSAVGLGLTIFITVAAWLAGPSAAAGKRMGGS